MANFFSDHNADMAVRPLGTPNSGFRPGQLGALHAAVSHFSVYEEPAILSLPTGYGKTAVMMALPFILSSSRVLVIEPSDVLRRQTAAHFASLTTLRKLGLVPPELANPLVRGQKGRLTSVEEWTALIDNDVVVSTPASTSPLYHPQSPQDLFDLVIFDEAHHAPADTWAAYLELYVRTRFVFLTATPFRRDKRAIPGRLAYFYPVSRASRENAFGKVRFRPAPVRNDHDEDEIDVSIAHTAVQQLHEDREAGFDHRLFARAASIKSARRLVDLYTAEGANVAAVDSQTSKRRQDQLEAALLEGQLDGIVCVDMFGEGYDFPKLKIAALHAPHRSLVPTLQFIGRFARTNDVATGDATLIAPLSRLREATSRLFEDGVDIATLIDAAAQEQLTGGIVDRGILEVLKTKIQAESDYDAVSPLSLELYAHTRIFECSAAPDFNLFGPIIGRNLKLAKQWISDDGLITLLLTVDNEPPSWATSDVLINVRHDAFLLAYNAATNLCFIGSTRRTDRLYIEMMQSVCRDQHRPISYESTRRAAAGLVDLKFYNLGLKNTAINTQAESYRVLTGPRAERAVTAGDARSFVQGHFFGSGSDGKERETIGASSSSRIWSNQRLTVSEYLDWVSKLNGRLNGTTGIAASQLDLVQHSRSLRALPALVIGGSWNKVAYRYAPRVRYRHLGEPNWNFRQITDLELSSFEVRGQELWFRIESDADSVPFVFSIQGGQLIRFGDNRWECEVMSHHDDWIDMANWLSMHPPAFFGADKSSFQGMNSNPPPTTVAMRLADSDSAGIDWTGCAIRIEHDLANTGGFLTVHQFLARRLQQQNNALALIYDHRSGEAADFIAVTREANDHIRISLYHCKGAGGEPSGGRVNDVYEVTCQILKSVAFCDAEVLAKHIEHRVNPGRHTSPSAFLIGNLADTTALLMETSADRVEFAVYGVQPGISKAQIDNHLSDLMAFSLDYVLRGGAAVASWIISN